MAFASLFATGWRIGGLCVDERDAVPYLADRVMAHRVGVARRYVHPCIYISLETI